MKSVSICVGVAAMGLVCVSANAQTKWTLASGYSDASFHTQNLREFAADVDRLTQGRVQIDVRSNNTLVKLADIRDAVGRGTVELGEVILTGIAKEFPIAGADTVPFVVRSMDDAKRLWALQRPSLTRQLGEKGLKLLYSAPWPSQGLYSVRQITKAAEFDGIQMRTYNATTIRIAEMLNAKPVDVPMVKVAEALEAGRMECMISSAVTGVENKVWTHLKYFYELNAWIPKNALLANQAAFSKLSAADQQAILTAANLAQARGWELGQKVASESAQSLKANGVKVEVVPLPLVPTFNAMGERFQREWVREAGVSGLELFIAYFLKQPT